MSNPKTETVDAKRCVRNSPLILIFIIPVLVHCSSSFPIRRMHMICNFKFSFLIKLRLSVLILTFSLSNFILKTKKIRKNLMNENYQKLCFLILSDSKNKSKIIFKLLISVYKTTLKQNKEISNVHIIKILGSKCFENFLLQLFAIDHHWNNFAPSPSPWNCCIV